ncbi:hypothetical protein [Schlesneria sp. T3-172]|uniref:hypothetical protein n=1 Tax=Schlesneria sphaerica TaxID=3373610 RepID=UPI0037C63369
MFSSRIFLSWIVCVTALAVTGCGSGNPKVHKASAVVRLDGEPFGPCQLLLAPLSKEKDARTAVGMVDKEGNVEFTTYKIGDGLPLGEFKVMVRSAISAAPPKPIPAVYQSEGRTPLRITVRDLGANEIALDMEDDKKKSQSSPNDISAKMNAVFQSDAFRAGSSSNAE